MNAVVKHDSVIDNVDKLMLHSIKAVNYY